MTLKIIITILDGSLKGTEFPFEYKKNQEYSIGRDSSCAISFPSNEDYTGISRKHCVLAIDPPNVKISSFSQNTFVNGIKVGEEFEAVNFSTNNEALIKIGKDNIGIKIAIEGNNLIDRFKDGCIHGKETLENGVKKIAPILEPVIAGGKAFAGLDSSNKDRKSEEEFIQANSEDKQSIEPNNQGQKNFPSIDKYNSYELIGKGVYKALTATKGTRLVVKTMLPYIKYTQKEKEQFAREIDIAKSLKHPNIVRWKNNGVDENRLYYSMEYCDIGNLEQLIANMGGKLPLDWAKSIILQVLDGLEYIHTVELETETEDDDSQTIRGLVHRDLRPQNILLTNSQLNLVAKIGDFGLSKPLEIAGSSHHSSTEQEHLTSYKFVSRRQVTHSMNAENEVDIWAAAACLYYMLTGDYPRNFADGIQQEAVILEQLVIPIRERNSDIPVRLAEVIDRALYEDSDKDNSIFYKTAKDFKEALLSSFTETSNQTAVVLASQI
jgi:eukaryotic-like serine/threonine-protein kinase